MASILLQMQLILCGCLALCVGAFPSHRYCGKLLMAEQIFQGRNIPVRTKYLQLSNNVDDFANAASAAASVASALTPAYPAAKRALERLLFHLPTATTTFPILENYVSRSSLESRILKVYNSSRESDAYTVIVGPKGAGKSSVVAHVLNNSCFRQRACLFVLVRPNEVHLRSAFWYRWLRHLLL